MTSGQRRKERHAQLEKVASSASSSSEPDHFLSHSRPPQSFDTHQPLCSSALFSAHSLEQPGSANPCTRTDRSLSPRRLMSPTLERLPTLLPPTDQAPSDGLGSSRDAALFIDPTTLTFDYITAGAEPFPGSSLDIRDQSSSLSAFLRVDDVSSASFADDRWMAVTELDLLRAAYINATRLKSADKLWDLTAASVFTTQPATGWVEDLPINLRPTCTQLTQPHHPSIDILPWPNVRDKLIKMWNMPEDLWPRHPIDQERLTLIRFVFDMESGGVRIWGANPSTNDGWEVDQGFVDVWWWALDQNVIAVSNRRRLGRGLPKLLIKSPTGLLSLGMS